MDFLKDFVDSLEPEYQNLFHDLTKVALVYLTLKYLGKSLLSEKNPFCNMRMVDELMQVFVLSLVVYHLLVNKFLL